MNAQEQTQSEAWRAYAYGFAQGVEMAAKMVEENFLARLATMIRQLRPPQELPK